MTKTQLPRSGASQWSADGDTWPGRTGFNAELSNMNAVFAIWGQGITSARPVAQWSGRYYWATDTLRLYYDNGTTWTEVSPVGGGGSPPGNSVGNAGAEGTSRIAARSDHVHALPVPSTDPGALTFGGSAARGGSSTVARSDHIHAVPALPLAASAPGAIAAGVAGVVGSAPEIARRDHTHTLAQIVKGTNGAVIGNVGSLPSTAAEWGQVQPYFIHAVRSADVNGAISIELPFTRGLLSVAVMNGDATAGSMPVIPSIYQPNCGPDMLYLIIHNGSGAARPGQVRMVGTVWGW